MKQLDDYLQRGTLFFIYLFVTAMHFSISVTQIALGLALAGWLLQIVVTKGAQLHRPALGWAFIAFIGAELLSLAFSTNFSESLVFAKRLLLIPIVYLVAFHISDKKELKLIITIFVLSLTLYSILGIFTYFTTPAVRVRHIQNSMTTGGITMIASLACLSLAIMEKDRSERMLLFLFGAFNAICLLLTSTRSAWLGFFSGLIFVVHFANRKALATIPALIFVFYLLTPRQIFYHVQHFFDPKWGTNVERLVMWQAGWNIFKEHPIVGIGDVNTANIFRKYAPPDFTYLIGHFHSNLVHIAVTLGAIGLIAYLFMMTRILLALFKARSMVLEKEGIALPWSVAAIAIVIGFHISGFFEWNFGDAEIITLFWFTVGATLSIPRLKT